MAKTFEAMQKKEMPTSSRWQFLDLKNRKQVGDLEKKIHQLRQKNNFQIFNFISCRGREGVSTVLANLANYISFQKSERKFLLIDANFQRPQLHKTVNTNLGIGLAEVLSGIATLSEAIVQLDATNLSVLSCGQDYNRMTGNISLEKFDAVLTEVKKSFDCILVDSSPVLVSSDAITTSTPTDATFLILQSLKVQREVAIRAKTLLQNNECQIEGVVLNRVRQVIPSWMYRII